MLNIFKILSKNSTSTKVLREKVTPEAIESAYKNRYKEIESLRKYDRGEKKITPSNLKNIVHSL